MNQIVKTENSVYEINTAECKVRRLVGVNDPTPRQGEDGVWKWYEDLMPSTPELGYPLCIVWSVDDMARCTITSVVREVTENDSNPGS